MEESAEKDEGGVLSSLNSMTRSRDQMGAVTCHSAGGRSCTLSLTLASIKTGSAVVNFKDTGVIWSGSTESDNPLRK